VISLLPHSLVEDVLHSARGAFSAPLYTVSFFGAVSMLPRPSFYFLLRLFFWYEELEHFVSKVVSSVLLLSFTLQAVY
jgi:hypothetical protein